MAKKIIKKAKPEEIEITITGGTGEMPVVPTPIAKLSIDYGREDLNNLAIKINEIIDRLNS